MYRNNTFLHEKHVPINVANWVRLINYLHSNFLCFNKNEETSLHVTALHGHPHVLKHLCKLGGNVDCQDDVSLFENICFLMSIFKKKKHIRLLLLRLIILKFVGFYIVLVLILILEIKWKLYLIEKMEVRFIYEEGETYLICDVSCYSSFPWCIVISL